MSAQKGAAQELRAGRLASFEDDDPAPALGDLLGKRGTRPSPSEPPTATSSPVEVPAQAPASDTPPDGGAVEASTTKPRSRTAAAAQPPASAVSAAPSTPPAADAPTGAATGPTGGDAGGDQTYRHRRNQIRSSSVHIPAAVLEKLIAHRTGAQMSNGEVVIQALESAHPHLGDLIHRPTGAGGALFKQRATRATRTHDGPLTALNIRLYEEDFEIIDGLVADFGAYSRGHLISTALAYFLSD